METNELIQFGLANIKRTMDRTLNGLTPAEVKWQPRPDANSIGLIFFNMARLEDSSMQSRLQGKPHIWESEKWCEKLGKDVKDSGGHYTAEQVAAFVVPKMEDLMGYSDAVRGRTLEYLKNAPSDEFRRKITLPPPPVSVPPRGAPAAMPGQSGRPPLEITVGQMLVMTLTHLAQHAGEISYLRGLQRGMDK